MGSNVDPDRGFVSSLIGPDRLSGPPTLIFSGTGVLSPGQNSRNVELTTHLHLVTRLRNGGVIPLLPLYAFMSWTGTNLPLIL